ncbi:MAG: hypothetical protein R3Y26_06715 [Rikenellaceae bacterium]
MARRIFLIISITLLSVFVVVSICISIAFNFVFSPKKFTPTANELIQKYVKSDVKMENVELTFFSSFPRFSAVIDSLQISQVSVDSLDGCLEADSIPNFITAKRCVVALDPMAFLNKKIKINRLHLEEAEINMIIDSTYTSLDVFAFESDTTAVDSLATNPLEGYSFEISGVQIDSSNVFVSNRIEQNTLSLDNINLRLDGNLNEKIADLDVLLSWSNITMKRDGKRRGLTGIAFSINSKLDFNRDSLLLTVDKANVNINEIALTTSGNVQVDSSKTKLFINLNSDLSTPSLSEFLQLIPPKIIKGRRDLTTKGIVNLNVNVNGEYSSESTPNVTAKLLIEDAAAKYNTRKVWLEGVNCDALAYINFNEPTKSYVDINNFTLSSTDIVDLATNGKITDLFSNPNFNINLKSDIDFKRLTEVFPLENNITLDGTNTSNLIAKFTLDDITSSNYGKMYIGGESSFDNIIISMADSIAQDTTGAYIHVEMSKGLLLFGDNVKTENIRIIKNASLLSTVNFSGLGLQDREGNFIEVENLNLLAATSFNTKTNEVTGIDVKFDVQNLNTGIEDNIYVNMKTSSAKVLVFPKNEEREARIKAALNTDSLNVYETMNNSDLALSQAGFNLEMTRLEPRVWDIDGTVGFSNFKMYSDMFPIDVVIPESKVTITDSEVITLDNTRVRIGNSLFATTGTVHNLLKSLFSDERVLVKGDLTLKSKQVNVAELIEVTNKSVLFYESSNADESSTQVTTDSTETKPKQPQHTKDSTVRVSRTQGNNPGARRMVQADSSKGTPMQGRYSNSIDSLRNNRIAREVVPETNMILVPKGINFTLNLDLHDVRYDSVLIDSFKGVAVVSKGKAVFNNVELEAIGAKATSSMMYKNINNYKSNLFMELNIKEVDIDRIGGLVPTIDSMMPMLKSFEGLVNFDLKTTSDVNQDMMLDFETVKSAISLDGQQLVLMDSETFEEVASMLKFKNDNRNIIDSLNVNIVIKDSNVEVLPFEIVIDRYRAIIGGSQTVTMKDDYDFDIDFNYNVSIMKSPLPFKAGVDIFGNLEDYDYKITKAKLKKTDFELVNTDFEEFRSTIKYE